MVHRVWGQNDSQFREEGFYMILGTISAVDSDNGLQLMIDGEDTATTKKYTYMASYVPAANDRVLIEEVGGSYVIMGKVINDVSSSGIVRQADTATTALNADNATTADTATTAISANSASVSDETKGFASDVNSQYGSLVYRVTREYNATLGTYIVTDVSLAGFDHYYVYK